MFCPPPPIIATSGNSPQLCLHRSCVLAWDAATTFLSLFFREQITKSLIYLIFDVQVSETGLAYTGKLPSESKECWYLLQCIPSFTSDLSSLGGGISFSQCSLYIYHHFLDSKLSCEHHHCTFFINRSACF